MSKEAKEVVLAAVEATNVLNTVSELIKLHSGLTEKPESYCLEISKAKHAVDLIRNQQGLQTSGVIAGIRMLQSHGEILKRNLVSLDNEDDQELRKMLEVFRSKRKGLVQQIRLAIPGLARTDGAITVDTKVVESTNEAVRKTLGKESGLIIAFFLAELDRNPDASGKIRLTGKEYEELTRHQIKATHPKTKTLAPEVKTRILCNCLARDQSIQILGPVAVDLWAGIAFIKIEGLISTDQAIQFGYPVTLDVFLEALDRQEKRIATSRTKELRN